MDMEIVFTLFVALVLVMQVKKMYHWKYLREVRSDLKRYESHSDFKDGADLSDQTEFWDQFGMSFELLLPFFWRDKSYTENEEAKQYAKKVFSVLAVIYVLIGLLVWRLA